MTDDLTHQAKQALIDSFRQGPSRFERFLASDFPAGGLDFRPDLPEAWTIREHFVHMVDADLHAALRIRMAIAEPGAAIAVWEEELWQRHLDYGSEPITTWFQLLKLERTLLAGLLQRFLDRDWSAWSVSHPLRGRLTLVDLLRTYVGHLDTHLGYMERNEGLFPPGMGPAGR